MAEKIGKYQLLERIGRGGMGTIFKAHDPILDRAVALKVISTEIEVTDELRARFFREAQACARLSHPNIVTIYDMGEEDGRLFIVMELLEGDELRRLITQRTALALEDKLAIMGQVCDGLHYAHQKGIVHRDIKPGNILVQRNGQVKILDFGIAQIAATEGGLTRTGLIMGTLRYISPEQVRGRADARSDMFSVGAVFYELLSLRPPFSGEDPMHLLEQLRTEEPPRLSAVDATIPVEVAAIVERAMRKEPGERFADLEEMRAQIEQVQQGLGEEAQRVRARARAQRQQLLRLRAALAERIGAPGQDAVVPAIEERGRLATVQALARDFADQIETLEAQLARAEALGPVLQRGVELLQRGQFTDAVMELEAIVGEMPEHARAVAVLGQARAGAAEERRRQLAVQLVQEARTTLGEGGHALCLELLKQAAEIPPPAELAQEMESLRQRAAAGLAVEESARRARQQAEQVREQMWQARRAAQAQAAGQYASGHWAAAEAKVAAGEAAFARGAYGEAGEVFAAAAAAYGRSEAAAGETQGRERDVAERAREQGVQCQRSAEAAGALRYARELWDAAEAKFAQARAAFDQKALGAAAGIFNDAVVLYRRAEGAAEPARQRERRRAEQARGLAAEGQRSAAGMEAERHAPVIWNEAVGKEAEGHAALAREQYGQAAEAFNAAVTGYHQAESQVREARPRQREQAEQGRQAMVERRRSALAADAALHAPSDWNEAEVSGTSGEAALAREAYAEAARAFEYGAAMYDRAERRAREAVRALEDVRAEAAKGREAAARARRAAVEAQAGKYAGEPWQAAENAEVQASAALGRQDYGGARSLLAEAQRQYGTAAQAAGVAAEAEARRAEAMLADARRLLEAGEVAACLRRLNEVLVLKPGHAAAEGMRLEVEERLRQPAAVAPAVTVDSGPAANALDQTFLRGEMVARVPTRVAEAPTELIEAPTLLMQSPVPIKASTILAGATPVLVAPLAAVPSAEAASEPGDAARVVGAVQGAASVADATAHRDMARRSFKARGFGAMASTGWPRRLRVPAAVIALGVLAAIMLVIFYPLPQPHKGREEAAELRKQTMAAREEATRADAEHLARALFAAADEKAAEADAALGKQDVANAQQLYREALEGYRLAKAAARAAEARRAAEEAEAPKRAPALWAKAGSAQSKAEDAVKGQAFDRARTLFDEAEKAYREAKVAAKAPPDTPNQPAPDLVAAEQARKRMTEARDAAELAGAAYYAGKLLVSAQAKERDANTVLGRSDYSQAIRLFGEAQSEYQAAAQEAKRQAERKENSGVPRR